jgi:hypothetical protein
MDAEGARTALFDTRAYRFVVRTYNMWRGEFLVAVNIRIKQNQTLWRGLALFFCALVFFFALHAKTSVYNGAAPAKLTPSTSCKLWSSTQRLEAKSFATGNGVLLWMALFCLFEPYFRREPRAHSAFLVPFPSNLPLRHLHRFLRPPPVLV